MWVHPLWSSKRFCCLSAGMRPWKLSLFDSKLSLLPIDQLPWCHWTKPSLILCLKTLWLVMPYGTWNWITFTYSEVAWPQCAHPPASTHSIIYSVLLETSVEHLPCLCQGSSRHWATHQLTHRHIPSAFRFQLACLYLGLMFHGLLLSTPHSHTQYLPSVITTDSIKNRMCFEFAF